MSFLILSLPSLLVSLLSAPFHAAAADEANTPNGALIRELDAEIERRKQAYQQKWLQRRKQITETAAEPRFEKYLAGFRRKIACSSSLHYPKAARGKIYGEMVVTVSILADGSFEKAHVEKGSGHKALDEGAIDIARWAAPFEPFPPEIRRDTDALDITRPWSFTYTEETAASAVDPCA